MASPRGLFRTLVLLAAAPLSALGCASPALAHAAPQPHDPDYYGKPIKAFSIHHAERFSSSKFPLHKKMQELHVNPGFFNASMEEKVFTPVAGQHYVWVINEDNDLVIGVEDVKGDHEAFADGALEAAGKSAKRRFGHPTLAVQFLENGKAVEGKGRISGTLYEADGVWTIDDCSGRYCLPRIDEDHVVLLQRAAELFQQHGIAVQPKLFTPKAPTHQLRGPAKLLIKAKKVLP